MSNAPAIAASSFSTTLSLFFLSSSDKFSIFTYSFAISYISFVSFCSFIISAKCSKPLAFATVALVFFFCLYGLYMSSTSAKVVAISVCFTISSVSFPCSSIDFIISCFLCSRFLKYVNLSPNILNCSSLKPPVTSFLYLAMNGIVFPSSISFIAFSTCVGFTCNSFEIVFIIFSIVFVLSVFLLL